MSIQREAAKKPTCVALGSPSNKERSRTRPSPTSKEVFKGAGVPGVPKTSRCHILKRLTKCGKADIRGRLLKNSTGNGIDKVCQRNFTLRNYIIWFYSPSFKKPLHAANISVLYWTNRLLKRV